MISADAPKALKGKPEAMPFAMTIMSGSRSKCSEANHLPVLPKPLCTSSAMRSMPCLEQSSLTFRMKSAGGTIYPPSPRRGSMTMQATSSGVIWYFNIFSRYSKHSVAQLPRSMPMWQRKQYGYGAW